MNIQQAKEQISNAMRAYFSKDEFGNYLIPIERQRPVYLLGAPGIGKTAIMAQIARELNVGLVSYSMTHHTRQSAIGLPYIVNKEYKGEEFTVSEYTLSEIIASVYEMIEKSGHDEGILFLDEINCVSETLTPAILQFLQYKIFGKHQIPQGWIVVTAGNPAEYNRSVHDFDIATWDRLKRIDVEPDFEIWKEYALSQGVHPSIITYLEIRPSDFYKIETTVDGKTFVTARGWDDLSQMILLYEMNGIRVDNLLVSQYLQNPEIAKRFAVYYDLFNKYKNDYNVEAILDGCDTQAIADRAEAAAFDERISFIALIVDALNTRMRTHLINAQCNETIFGHLSAIKLEHADADGFLADCRRYCEERAQTMLATINKERSLQAISKDDYISKKRAVEFLESLAFSVEALSFDDARARFYAGLEEEEREEKELSLQLERALAFIEDLFGESQEQLLMITDLSSSAYSMKFINEYGSEGYFKAAKRLQFHERGADMLERIARLEASEG